MNKFNCSINHSLFVVIVSCIFIIFMLVLPVSPAFASTFEIEEGTFCLGEPGGGNENFFGKWEYPGSGDIMNCRENYSGPVGAKHNVSSCKVVNSSGVPLLTGTIVIRAIPACR